MPVAGPGSVETRSTAGTNTRGLNRWLLDENRLIYRKKTSDRYHVDDWRYAVHQHKQSALHFGE
jgi:hypothetical protein